MKKTEGYHAVSVDQSRIDEFFEVDQWAFVGEWLPEDRQAYIDAIPLDRARAIEVIDVARGPVGTLAGVHASFGTDMVVPGGSTVRCAGLSWLGVHPTHRRRGIMSAMVRDHFERSRARGEHVSVLYAMESEIYARFGYGLASHTVKAEVPRGAKLWSVAGTDHLTVRLERADQASHDELVTHLQSQLTRPGTVRAPEGSGRNARFTDPVGNRRGMEKWRLLIVEDRGSPVAYAFFRRKADSSVGIHDGVCQVREQGALTPAAAHKMWSVLLDFDLVGTTITENVAVDDPLMHLLKDARAAGGRVIDNLWVRLLDVPQALQSREFFHDVDVTVEVHDKHIPRNSGTWRITAAGGNARVTQTDQPAALECDIRHLGAAFLGGTSLESLAAAGLVTEHSPGAVRDLALAMWSPVAPLANWDF